MIKIIANPKTYGGKAIKKWPLYEKALKDANIDFDIEWTKTAQDGIRITKEASKDYELLVAFGGDGTVNEVVTGIGQTGFKNILGIIPVGRGNDNAFNIRQTKKIEDIVDMLQKKEYREIDCIKINDGARYCMGVAGVGLDADVAEQVFCKGTNSSYNIALIKSFFRYRPRHLHIDVDDGKIVKDLKSLTTMIGNGQRVGSGLKVTPDAIIDDGLLDIMIVGNTGVIESLITSRRLGKGTHLTNPKINVFRGKKVTITTESIKKIHGHAMGEYIGQLPITFECIYRVLKILKMSDAILERENWLNANAFSQNIK
ncbi:MAG: diacylglycerol kinase family lipid kinase [Candidatus Heimdallarchaeota archaeon]|nr:diacylglycerol kinase family lipid kinase [Candidatus Heimdallarchaeota archaeon]